jgi:D-serine dehydratase
VKIPAALAAALASKQPLLWINPNWRPLAAAVLPDGLDLGGVLDAQDRLQRYAGLLAHLFPELRAEGGRIESPLHAADAFQKAVCGGRSSGSWLIKSDHALPVAGSIKARGGIYEVLLHAEELASRTLSGVFDDPMLLASPAARILFGRHRVVVGSTGNLGLSIGVMAAALGFRATVHMSSDAKAWKKARLRERGVEVIEHEGDFGAAVLAGREQALEDPWAYFVDDEQSPRLFLGYSVAALRLKEQLAIRGIVVDSDHPLFVYLPCGVGGAPGGITFGLRHLFGDHAHCFFAEPVAAPSMLLRLATCPDEPISVGEVGLDNRTEADGLAVARASQLAAPLMRPLVSGVFTVADASMYEDLYLLGQCEALRIEPSAAAGLRGPLWLVESAAGREYLAKRGLTQRMPDATHILWTTGGSLLPSSEYSAMHQQGERIYTSRSVPA